MRSTWKGWPALSLAIVLAASGARAEDSDVHEQLQQLNERISHLEDRLQATSDDLVAAQARVAEQQQTMERAGIGDEGSKSSLSAFLEATEFSGWVGASYNFNFNRGGNDGLNGQNSFLPFYPDSNTFQVDQLWFEIDKDVSEEGRGGFHADLVFGKHASLLSDGTDGNDGVEVFTAYASYLVPTLEYRVDVGELPTLIGAEVVQSPQNFNLTRGVVWGLQPVTHTGVIVSGPLGDKLQIAAGAVNDIYTDTDRDSDNMKAVTAQLAFGDEVYTTALSWIYGSNVLRPGIFPGGGVVPLIDRKDDDRTSILDFLVTAQPTEAISVWINADWVRSWNGRATLLDSDGNATGSTKIPSSQILGVAVAGRWQVLDRTAVALRGEYVKDFDGAVLGYQIDTGAMPPNRIVDTGGGDIWTLTATVDQQLTENLLFRLEGRFDWVSMDGGSDDFFADAGGRVDASNQHVLLAQLLYQF